MSLTIDLAPETEDRLREMSERQGLPAEDYARHLIEFGLLGPRRDRQGDLSSTLAAWDEEDETDDPAEVARRISEWEEFKNAINETRRSNGEDPLYP